MLVSQSALCISNRTVPSPSIPSRLTWPSCWSCWPFHLNMPRHLSSLIDPVNVHLVSLTPNTKWSDMSSSLWSLVLIRLRLYPVADPDLQIRMGGGHPDPEIRGSSKKFFSALRASVWSKNRGGPGSPGPSHGSATATIVLNIHPYVVDLSFTAINERTFFFSYTAAFPVWAFWFSL